MAWNVLSFCHTYRSRQLKLVVQAKCRRRDIQNAPTFARVQLQNFSSRSNEHANADGLSRMTEEETEWERGKKEQVTGQCPDSQEIEVFLKKFRDRCAMA